MKFRLEPKKLGHVLGQLRQKTSMSQAKISKICQVNSPQYISNIERGQCLPSLKILKTMLEEYQIDEKDKRELISLFLEAAQNEIEDIFKVELETEHQICFIPKEDCSSCSSMEVKLPTAALS